MPKPSPGQKPDPMAGIVDRLLSQLPGLQGQPDTSRRATREAAQWGTGGGADNVDLQGEPDRFGLWVRVVLSLALGVMMAAWPYPRTCGVPLTQYLAAVGAVIIAGVWAAAAAWRYRSALAHILSLILVFYGTMLAAAELLPRTGYAADHATWECLEGEAGVSALARNGPS